MSLASNAASGPLKLGERVIVSSQTGTKAGTLRFMGPTEFAAGDWAGVELDTPVGKNDGSVDNPKLAAAKSSLVWSKAPR